MTDVDILITGGTILTLDDNFTGIEDGALAILGDTIIALGKSHEITSRFTGRAVIPADHSLVMPGLVNGHTHAAMTCFRGIADDMELMTWLNNYIFPAEAKNVNPELVHWGSLLACAEMIKSGTTTFCDMYLFEEETALSAKMAGMRCLLGEVMFDFPSPNAGTPADGLACTRRLAEKWDADPLIHIIVEPHSLYTCSPSLLAEAKLLADEYNLPYGVHLLENSAERTSLHRKFGKKAIEFLKDIGYLTDRFLAYHCVSMDDEDVRIFADHGCKAVHNPESNMKLSSGIAPVPAMLNAGVTVGLGTDGCASNNNLDMFQEMDTAAKLHKVASLDPTVMDAKTVIRMATCEGAKALGMEQCIGSLEVGKKADIIMIDLNKPHLTPLYNEYSHLVYAAGGADVDTVFINGKMVMNNRRLLTINEEEIMAHVREFAVRIKNSLRGSDERKG
jgi:5-methylthioadenosine/S-adenosylhomocysteine deaminase